MLRARPSALNMSRLFRTGRPAFPPCSTGGTAPLLPSPVTSSLLKNCMNPHGNPTGTFSPSTASSVGEMSSRKPISRPVVTNLNCDGCAGGVAGASSSASPAAGVSCKLGSDWRCHLMLSSASTPGASGRLSRRTGSASLDRPRALSDDVISHSPQLKDRRRPPSSICSGGTTSKRVGLPTVFREGGEVTAGLRPERLSFILSFSCTRGLKRWVVLLVSMLNSSVET
mmetsp:Transcript_38143/g.95974  ORF Transcript_38143/g.95974 Transcript_38143/m.95974 type:complete len:227 (-) Transcript_38143:105-785(-)